MAKESLTSFEVTNVVASKNAKNVDEKRYTSLNGFDTALRKDARLLIFSDFMKEEKRKRRDGTEYKFQFFWAIDITRNKLVQPSRTGLSGGMGYEQLPEPGIWGYNEAKTWHILQPKENDPALSTRKSWGIGRLLPGAFDYTNKEVSVPRCFIIEVTDVKYLCGRSPIDSSLPESVKARELADLTFKEDTVRMWDGRAYYPTRDEIKEIVSAYNAVHMSTITDEIAETLLK